MELPELIKENIEKAIIELENIDFDVISVDDIKEILNPLFTGLVLTLPKYDPVVHIYRGRICSKPKKYSEILYPPQQFITEYGRANNIGKSLFYGTVGRAIPFFELRAKVGDKLIISLFKTKDPLVLNHIGYTKEAFEALKSKRAFSDIQNNYDFLEKNSNPEDLNTLVYNYLATVFTQRVAKENNNYYKLSVALAEVLLNPDEIHGIMYPTIAMDGNAENIVLKPEYVDKSLGFIYVQYAEITKIEGQNYSFDVLDTAVSIDSNGEFIWTGKTLSYDIEPKEVVNFAQKENDWIGSDNFNNRIYPKAEGNDIIPITPLMREFRDDFPDVFKLGQEFDLEGGGKVIPIKVQLSLQFEPPNRFLSFYVPQNDDPVDITKSLFNAQDQWLNLEGDGKILIKNEDGSIKISSDNLTYSKTIHFYSEIRFDTSSITSNITEDFTLIFHFPAE